MTTQKERMLAGELYDAGDPELVADHGHARRLIHQLTAAAAGPPSERAAIIRALLPNVPPDVVVEPPFYCDYGYNIHAGTGVYFNFNVVVLDVTTVTIGAHVLFGPAVQIYTATHPLDAAERRTGLESARPVRIGDDCWIGGGAIICPGVSIGPRTVVGAGSVVTRDLPADVVVGGNPCRVLRRLGAGHE